MKKLVRLLTFISLLTLIISAVLLLNITAPNPTGRRYSSTAPITDASMGSNAIGLSAENILSADLGLPRNEDASQRQCICKNAAEALTPNECNSCFAHLESVSTSSHRRPDFVGKGFIAESKNRRNLLYEYTDQVDQISDYAAAARLLNQPLWVFVRVNTVLSPEFHQIVESTGGGVVRYFTVPGYVDPIDSLAQKIFVGSFLLLLLLVVGQMVRPHLPKIPRTVQSPSSPTPKPPRTPKPSGDPVSKAIRKTDAAEDFVQRSKDKHRLDIDIEDSRDDL